MVRWSKLIIDYFLRLARRPSVEWGGEREIWIMNWKQKICLYIGILVAVGMLVYPPIDIAMMSLRFYLGDPNARMKIYTVYRFMPEGGLRAINWLVLCTQWFIVAVIVGLLIYLFRKKQTKFQYDTMSRKKRFFCIIALCLGGLGGVLGVLVGAKCYLAIQFIILPLWADHLMYNIVMIVGAVIGFYLIWFIVWFITHLFEGVTEANQMKNRN